MKIIDDFRSIWIVSDQLKYKSNHIMLKKFNMILIQIEFVENLWSKIIIDMTMTLHKLLDSIKLYI